MTFSRIQSSLANFICFFPYLHSIIFSVMLILENNYIKKYVHGLWYTNKHINRNGSKSLSFRCACLYSNNFYNKSSVKSSKRVRKKTSSQHKHKLIILHSKSHSKKANKGAHRHTFKYKWTSLGNEMHICSTKLLEM